MTDKMLRYLLLQGFRLYVHRRIAVYKRRAIVAGLGAVVVAGVIAAGKQAAGRSGDS